MNQRRRLTGIVTSNRMMKTVVVEVSRTYQHPLYRKVVHSRQKVKAHDELGCKIGDKVQIVETAPISKEKTWVVESILKREGKTLEVAEEAVE
ncbi:MAG: 30S ribosomal protein S17 [Anaerolineaceae bacterium]|nr:30S ribosomal protein S17 [Anaerolineaceae bacterium]